MSIDNPVYEPPVLSDADGDFFRLAIDFALQTNEHIFLTGKAGSGKTTLLKKVASLSAKNFIIVAPTGVAAINAGGVTIHSMFHFPFTTLVPTDRIVDANVATNRRMLTTHMRFNRDKKKVLEELEMMIIDEVSMVRADILDGIDFALQHVRKNKSPFGGVQVMLIGDMHQLPPVVRDHEWNILKEYYASPYFFDSLAWKKLNAVQVELKKIFRQQDEVFLRILNNIRDKNISQEDYDELAKRYNPDFKPSGDGYVLLSTHNRKADEVNARELKSLPGKSHTFKARVEGEFPESMYPCDPSLQLKVGAQVMFVRNDTEGGKYFNGKLAQVKKIDGDEVIITFNDNDEDFILVREMWENISYSIEKGTNKVLKNELGSFTQYPLRLAWAITIHKSQGLTFDKVIIDAGQSFAAGQVYVALSRCRTLEGIVLHSRITQSALFNDEKINAFSESHHKEHELKRALDEARAQYADQMLKRLFSFEKILYGISDWKEVIAGKDIPEKASVLELNEKMHKRAEEIVETAGKFQTQLQALLRKYNADPSSVPEIRERCTKAIDYFAQEIFVALISPLHLHIETYALKAKLKKYLQFVDELEETYWMKIGQLYGATFMNENIYSGKPVIVRPKGTKASSALKGKKMKGETYRDTLALHKNKKSIEEIASIRSLAVSTVKSHLARLIKTGSIDIRELLPDEMIIEIESAMRAEPDADSSLIKSRLSDKYDYDEIRMVYNYLHKD